jgi:hypothetical protein
LSKSDYLKRYVPAQQKDVEQKQKELLNEQKKLSKKLKDLVDQQEIDMLHKNTVYALTAGMKAALQWQDITQVASQFGLNLPKFISAHGESILGSSFDSGTDLQKPWLDAVCGNNIQDRNSYVLGLDSHQRVGFTLYGTKTQGDPIDTGDPDTGQQPWQYVVGGQILFEPGNTDSYTISLRGSGGSKDIFQGSDTWSAGGASLISDDEDTDLYDSVCVTFASKDVSDLFHSTQTHGREQCVPLKVRA